MKKISLFYIMNFCILMGGNEAHALDIFKSTKTKCMERCIQSEVCKDVDVAQWCGKNCTTVADAGGKIMNGVCFETTKHNHDSNSTKVTKEFAQKSITSCKNRINESKHFPAFLRGVPNSTKVINAVNHLTTQMEDMMKTLAAPIEKDLNNYSSLSPSALRSFSGDLISYVQACNNLNDKISDLAYWFLGKTPPGGFKNIKGGTSKKEMDAMFQKIINENQ